MEELITGAPGASAVLDRIDYDRYAHAEAALGWLNASVKITGARPFSPAPMLEKMISRIGAMLRERNGGIGHLKLAATSRDRSIWANLTSLGSEPSLGGPSMGDLSEATLLVNARVQMEPAELESLVREAVAVAAGEAGVESEFTELECFSPSYPNPPYLVRTL